MAPLASSTVTDDRSGSGGSENDIVIDAGVPDSGSLAMSALLKDKDVRSLMVLRPCYLAIRRATSIGMRADGLIVVREEGRSLSIADIEAAVSVPVVAEIVSDQSIARAIDIGLMSARLPRGLTRPLRRLVDIPLVVSELESDHELDVA